MKLTTDQELMLAEAAGYKDAKVEGYTVIYNHQDMDGFPFADVFDLKSAETLQRLRFELKISVVFNLNNWVITSDTKDDHWVVIADSIYKHWECTTQQEIDDAIIECAVQILEARENV